MREHIEMLVVALSDVFHTRRTATPRRRPRVARTTYVPVRRGPVVGRFAH